MSWWQRWRGRLETLFEQYGSIAIGTYLVLYAITWTSIYTMLQMGFEFSSAASTTGAVGATCAVNKGIQPFRIAAALGLTPLVAGVLERVRGPVPASDSTPDIPSSTEPPSTE